MLLTLLASILNQVCLFMIQVSLLQPVVHPRLHILMEKKGLLLHRGYKIEDLAEKSDYPEVCYLLLNGELPNQQNKKKFINILTHHTMLHEQILRFYSGFRRDSHPMAVMVGIVGALSSFILKKIMIFRLGRKMGSCK